MGTRTISVDEEAYLRLVRARCHARESFSKNIKRASWEGGPPRCGDLLRRASGEISDEVWDRLEGAREADIPLSSPRHKGMSALVRTLISAGLVPTYSFAIPKVRDELRETRN